MSIAAIIDGGIGPGASVPLVVTLGYNIGAQTKLVYVLSETIVLPFLNTTGEVIANGLLALPPDGSVGKVPPIISTLAVPGILSPSPLAAASSSIILPMQSSALIVS